jgi:hypothetical protein
MRLLLALVLLLSFPANAGPVFIGKFEQMTIVLHDDPCKLEAVSNLKRRATWQDKDGITEGCWGYIPQIGVVIFYFADKTVTALPMPFFEKASGA